LELQIAGRMDYYSDFGNAVTPKFALKYSPREDLVFRGSYGQGFRAPSLQELYLGSSVSYDFAVDPATNSPYYNMPRQYRITRAGNPALNPETSENWSASMVYEPKIVPGLSLNASWGRIDLKDAIDSFPNSYILDNLTNQVSRNFTNNAITSITNSWSNLGSRKVQFLDLGASYSKPTSWGEFTFTADFSWLYSSEDQTTATNAFIQLAGTYDSPKWRGNGSLFWTYRKFTAGASLNWVGGFDQAYAVSQSTVADWITVDLQCGYQFPKDISVTLGVHNIADEDPPFADGESEGYSFVSHDPIGRYWYLQVTKKF
jgi:iron complex outermembrane receptor protein